MSIADPNSYRHLADPKLYKWRGGVSKKIYIFFRSQKRGSNFDDFCGKSKTRSEKVQHT